MCIRDRHKPFIMAGALASGSASLFRVCLCNERGFLAANLLSGLASAMWISFMVFYTGKYPQDQQKATSRIVLFNNLGMLLGFVASTLCYSRIGMGKICALKMCIRDRIKAIEPEATFMIWMDCRGLGFQSQKELKDFMFRDAKVLLNDGTTFGEKEGKGFMLSLIHI